MAKKRSWNGRRAAVPAIGSVNVSDYDEIAARWDANFAKRNMAGKAVKVGTFNKHLTDAGHGDRVKNPWGSTAEEDFGVAQGCDGNAPLPAVVSRPQVVLEKGKLPRAARQTKKYLIGDLGEGGTSPVSLTKFLDAARNWCI